MFQKLKRVESEAAANVEGTQTREAVTGAARGGFTLIEMLIVIAITALLAGLVLTYSSQSRDQVTLTVEQAKLAQIIVQAKSLTVDTYNQPEIPCGYGVDVDYAHNAYTLFSYNAPDCTTISTLDPDYETVVSTNQLQPDLQFVPPDGAAVQDILFLPPNPDTWVWAYGADATTTNGSIMLESKSGKVSASVSVSSAGQVSF